MTELPIWFVLLASFTVRAAAIPVSNIPISDISAEKRDELGTCYVCISRNCSVHQLYYMSLYVAPYFDGNDDIERYCIIRQDWADLLLGTTEITGGEKFTFAVAGNNRFKVRIRLLCVIYIVPGYVKVFTHLCPCGFHSAALIGNTVCKRISRARSKRGRSNHAVVSDCYIEGYFAVS